MSTDVFLKLVLNILELWELHNDCSLAADKIEIEKEMLPEQQFD